MTVTFIRCDHCNTPIGQIKDGHLEVRLKHHGQKHTSRIPIASQAKPVVASANKK